MDYGLVFWPEVTISCLNILMGFFLTNMQLFTSQDVK